MSTPPRLIRIVALLVALLTVAPIDGTTAGQTTPGLVAPNRAGLVIIHGDGSRTSGVVAFTEDEISGMDLLRRSGIDVLSVPFGGLGEGICQIEREGCEVTQCRRTVCQTGRDEPFWQLFDRVATDGSWSAARLGVSASRVSDGQVVVWAWTGQPLDVPVVTIDDVAAAAGVGPDEWPTFGSEGETAVVNSGYAAAGGPAAGPIGGLAGLAGIVVLGAVILGVRRARLVH